MGRRVEFADEGGRHALELRWGGVGLNEGHERVSSASGAVGRAQEPRVEVIFEQNSVKLTGELAAIDVGPEFTFIPGQRKCMSQHLVRASKPSGNRLSEQTITIIKIDRGGKEDAAAMLVAVDPSHPVLKQRDDPGHTAARAESRAKDLFFKIKSGKPKHRDLELLLGSEMAEEAALRELEFCRQFTDREPIETDFAGKFVRALDDFLSRGCASGGLRGRVSRHG